MKKASTSSSFAPYISSTRSTIPYTKIEMDERKALEEGVDEEQPDQLNETLDTLAASATTIDESTYWWASEDAAVLKKMDLHIMLLLCLTYLFAFLDRSNIGNAKTAGMLKSLDITDKQYQWLLTIFYISYIIFQFGVLGYKLFPPSKWIGSAVIAWGVVAILQATAFNWSGLMAARFFIGVAEACYGTGVALYLSFFYPRKEVGLRFAWFLVGSTIASALAGTVAYGLQNADVAIDNWRLIFIVEAAPTIIVGIAVFFYLPDSISTARFLSPHQRKVAEARLYRAKIDIDIQNRRSEKTTSNDHALIDFVKSRLDVSNFASALKDPMSYVSASLLFIVNVSYSSIPVYLPTILQGMGYTSIRAQAFSAPPYVAAFIFAVSLVYISDRTDVRGCFVVLVSIIGAIGYIILGTIEDDHTRYGAIWLVVLSLFSFIPLAYSWLISNSLGESKKGLALTMFGMAGQMGPILGTRLFPERQRPYYRRGMFISAGLLLLGTLIASATLIYLSMKNHAKEKEMAELLATSSGEKEEALQYLRKLNLDIEEHRQELHRRKNDIAINLEKSIYFRYSL